MKKTLAIALCLMSVYAAFGEAPVSWTVNSTSICIAASRGIQGSFTTWVNGYTNSQGVIYNVSNKLYMAVNGGVSTAAPSHEVGMSAVGLDAVRYLRVYKTQRQGIAISLVSTGQVFLGIGGTAVDSAGVILTAGNPMFSIYGYQGEIHAITDDVGAQTIGVNEW